MEMEKEKLIDTNRSNSNIALIGSKEFIEDGLGSIVLVEEYRLIERTGQVLQWRGIHITLLGTCFISGFCSTLFFHYLCDVVDEKCMFTNRAQLHFSHKGSANHTIVDTITEHVAKEIIAAYCKKWLQNKISNLPKFMSLASGICALIWACVMLISTTGASRQGIQHPYRIFFPMMIFSFIMSIIGIYTGSTIDVGLPQQYNTNAYNNPYGSFGLRIERATAREIQQSIKHLTKLTVFCTWICTICWICTFVLTVIRILFRLDFDLICVRAELRGTYEALMQRLSHSVYEKQIRIVSPDISKEKNVEDKNNLDTDKLTHEDSRGFMLYMDKSLPNITDVPRSASIYADANTIEETIRTILSRLLNTVTETVYSRVRQEREGRTIAFEEDENEIHEFIVSLLDVILLERVMTLLNTRYGYIN